MLQDLRQLQTQQGAIFEDQVPVSFGQDAAAIAAAQASVALYDRSHWGRIEVSDADRLNFLHNQSTHTLKLRQPGEGCDTVFVTSTARTIDLATAYLLEQSVLLTVSPQNTDRLMQFLDRYIFFADKVKLADLTQQTAMFSLIGPTSHEIVQAIGASELLGQPYGSHQTARIADCDVRIAVGSGLATPGYTIWMPAHVAATVWAYLTDMAITPLGDRVWEQLRIQQGRPAIGHELTEDYNPLEAGLWHLISFNKGCYIGQETIARLDTYNGVKQQLWGVQLAHPVTVDTPVCINEEKVGRVTSVIAEPSGNYRGLVYVRTKAGGAGLRVTIGEEMVDLLDLPYLTRAKQL
ncbi:folate-binding protein YgfZ [Alkalinema sp. FACHB-956]|uniref:CAF17-like 4Fe-4S cluster assembly/insertion protein YgfZ n=1 Tax=Alkalinema sp. FACHB-956 TaxID=2692768 RepID=UPI0016897395|nr:folate-binding protein YgfZ [Alkalinema sp. FACHB-956]MBD2327466.1 folate-binding protein YgfZ [Alkalinema sp. FACHB-956]